MEAPLLQVSIEKDVMTTPVVRVYPHEIPILQAKYGVESVSEVKGGAFQSREFDPAVQFGMLTRKYGADNESGHPWVQVVYGQAFEGRLDKAMQRSAEMMKKKSKEESDVSSHKDKDAGAAKD